MPMVRGEEPLAEDAAPAAWTRAIDAAAAGLGRAGRVLMLVSPMLSCEDAFHLVRLADALEGSVTFAVGPVPVAGEDQVFLDGFRLHAEKAPNARGIRRVLGAGGREVLECDAAVQRLPEFDGVLLTGNYPSDWVTEATAAAVPAEAFVLALETLPNRLLERADVVLPAATWLEKAGTFENASNRLQAFDRAIDPIDFCKSEAQIAIDLLARIRGEQPTAFNPAMTRQAMASEQGLSEFLEVATPSATKVHIEPDMELVEL